MNDLGQLTTQIKDTFADLVNSVVRLQDYKTTARIHHSTLEIIVGRIEEQEVDVIVNATNTSLSGASGVDDAIHQVAGPQLVAAGRALAPCRAGDAVLTPGFKLPTPWVIHTVGPMYIGGHQDEATILDRAYRTSMNLAVQSGLTQIALPSISTGSRGYPVREAAQIAIGAVLEFIDGYRNSELLIRFVLDTRSDYAVYDNVLKEFADPSKSAASGDSISDSTSDELFTTVPAPNSLESADENEENVLSVDVDAGSDIYLNIEETEVLTVDMGSGAADISLDHATIANTPLVLRPESVISIDLPAGENVTTEEDVDLVAARAELESALSGLQSAQDEFRSAKEEEEAEAASKLDAEIEARKAKTAKAAAAREGAAKKQEDSSPASTGDADHDTVEDLEQENESVPEEKEPPPR